MKKSISRKDFLRWLIVWSALSMMFAGIANGEVKTVLAKAVNICLECIGIG